MKAYEFYWEDKEGRELFLGILPERRKNPERINDKSILNWARLLLGEWVQINNIRFNEVELCSADFSLSQTSLESS